MEYERLVMSFISYSTKGDWRNTMNWLQRNLSLQNTLNRTLHEAGQMGVNALEKATPMFTGLAATSWEYKINNDESGITIEWHNFDIEGGYNVVILVKYGHATRGGTFVQGRDFVTPALEPIFEEIADRIWKEVTA